MIFFIKLVLNPLASRSWDMNGFLDQFHNEKRIIILILIIIYELQEFITMKRQNRMYCIYNVYKVLKTQ